LKDRIAAGFRRDRRAAEADGPELLCDHYLVRLLTTLEQRSEAAQALARILRQSERRSAR
jgi:hypothetical protein